jgi:hypothetical protein
VSEKGSAKPQTKPIDFTSLKSFRQVDREGTLFWTHGSVALNDTYPEQTPYSNGPTEGHVNRLKLFKRQMYGRAKLDLLRQRVLYAA